MLKFTARDLVIRLDERRRVLQFLVPKGKSAPGDLRVFYEISEEDAAAAEDATLEHHLGLALLSFLSATYTSSAFRLGEYRDAAKAFADQLQAERKQELEDRTSEGDATAMYERAMQRVAEGLRAKSRAAMNEAEVLFEQAAAHGNVDAAEYLSNLWPSLKERSDRTFK
jgi:hypothetical protein